MVTLLYVAHNRLAFTQATFTTLHQYTDWNQITALHIHDDASKDGTAEWLYEASRGIPTEVKYESRPLGGPVAAMNRHLDLFPETSDRGAFVKIDNDFVVCPGWLPELLQVASKHPGTDVFGLQPRLGPPQPPPFPERSIEPARFIGGIGLIRQRAFEACRPTPNGRYGWTEWQFRHPAIGKAWVVPDLPCFCLDLIDLEPWASLTTEYIERGWAREWPKYERNGGAEYFRWWTESQVAA